MGFAVKLLVAVTIAPAVVTYKVLDGVFQNMKGSFERKPKPVHGSAAFMTERELRKFSKAAGIFPGVTDSGRRVRLGLEESVVMFGKRGMGKTQTANANIKGLKDVPVKPDLLIADDHGDIEVACREDLEAMGYVVLVVDLSNPRGSAIIDPLRYLQPYAEFEYEREVQRLSHLMMPDSGKESDAGEHFLDNARAVLEAAIVVEMEKENPGISNISEFLLTDKKARTSAFDRMRKHPNRMVKAGVEAFEAAGDRERGSMDTTLARKLRPWLSATLKHITTGEGIDFDEMFLDERPHAVFIRSSGAEGEHSGAFIRLVMGIAIYTAKRIWNVTKTPLPKGLLLIVDEPETVGNCQAFVIALKELRKVGVNLFIFFQSFQAVKDTYRDWSVILQNCVWLICGGGNDLKLYKEASELSGVRTIVSKTVNKGDHKSESEHETGAPLIRADEIQALQKGDCVVIGQGILAKLKLPFISFDKGGKRWVKYL